MFILCLSISHTGMMYTYAHLWLYGIRRLFVFQQPCDTLHLKIPYFISVPALVGDESGGALCSSWASVEWQRFIPGDRFVRQKVGVKITGRAPVIKTLGRASLDHQQRERMTTYLTDTGKLHVVLHYYGAGQIYVGSDTNTMPWYFSDVNYSVKCFVHVHFSCAFYSQK